MANNLQIGDMIVDDEKKTYGIILELPNSSEKVPKYVIGFFCNIWPPSGTSVQNYDALYLSFHMERGFWKIVI